MADARLRADVPEQAEVLPDGTVLRPLSERGELEECVELQRRVWGRDFADVASPAILKIVQEVGGVAAGAFSPRGELAGFVFGVTGWSGGRPLHWSHMLAVVPEARGRDLGFRLKLFQRRRLLSLGVETVRWTYDPLVAQNAYLNVARLGARPIRYVRDYYGSGTDSALSAGIGTDRFVVDWRIASSEVEGAIAGSGGSGRPETAGGLSPEAPVVNAHDPAAAAGPGEPVVAEPPELPAVRVEVPPDIQALRRESPEEALRWRASTRRALETLLERGYSVESFERTGTAPGGRRRCFYRLRSAR